MVWPAVIAAAGAIGAGLISKRGQEKANETNMNLSQEQMDFQERMSSTAYQRAMIDMQAAGLNPMLAYSQGGASAPIGSMPQVQNEAGAGVSSAQAAMGMINGIVQAEQGAANAEKIKAETRKINAETLTAEQYSRLAELRGSRDYHSASLTAQQQLTEVERARLVENEAALKKVLENIAGVKLDVDNTSFSADVARRQAESELRVMDVPRMAAEEKFFKDLGQANPYLRQLLLLLRAVGSAAGMGR